MRYLTFGLGWLEASGGTCRRPRRRAAAIGAAGLLALSCAGGSDPEPAARLTAASAVPLPEISLTMVPSVGEHTFEWGPDADPLVLTPAISWTLDFTALEDRSELWIRMRLLREDGTPCLISAGRVGRVTRGERYVAFGDRFDMPEVEPRFRSFCTDRFATETVDVNFVDGPVLSPSHEPPVRQGYSFTHFFFFERISSTPDDEES